MGYNSNKKLTAAQLAALEVEIAEDIESGIAGGVYARIAALENAMPITSIDSFTKLKQIVAAGHAAGAVVIGDQLVTKWTDTLTNTAYDVAQNVCHISESETFSDDGGATEATSPGLFMQWHYATPYDMPFDAKEALYKASVGGLAAGTYYFKVTGLASSWDSYEQNNNKTFMFTLTDDLPEGAMLMMTAKKDTVNFTSTNICVVDSPYTPITLYNRNYGTAGLMPLSIWDDESGAPLTGDTSAYSTGGNGLNHIQRAITGYDRWSQSALRQWLNSAAPARVHDDAENYPGWWTPQNDFDCIPLQAVTFANAYANPVTINTGKPGFLSGYDADFINAMRPVKVATAKNTLSDGGSVEYTFDKVFLPSLTQMNIQQQYTEGYKWDYYLQLFVSNPVEGRTDWKQTSIYPILKGYGINSKNTAVTVCLRSSYRNDGCSTWAVYTSGYVNHSYGYASDAYRARPACVIG